MKRNLALLLALSLALCLFAGCGQAAPAPTEAPVPEAEPVEIIVFAAASMQETLSEAIEMYKTVAPNVTVTASFESSGTLKTQIQEGADCQLFISAGQKQMNQLDITADAAVNTDGLDFVLQGTRVNLLENKVTLVVPEGNPKGIESFDDMVAGLKDGSIMLAMGNSDVPVGQYTQKILAFYELDEAALAANISYGTNVKEVTSQVSEAAVDCGVVYCTDAFSAGLTVVASATKEMCGQVIYPAALMQCDDAAKVEAAQAFLDYLQTDEVMAVFEGVGFAKVA